MGYLSKLFLRNGFSLIYYPQNMTNFLSVRSQEILEFYEAKKEHAEAIIKQKEGIITAITCDVIPTYNLVSVTEKQLVFEKMRALLQRKKPRDFYDLYFILRKQLPLSADKEKMAMIHNALQGLTINFDAELRQFLPKSQWAIIHNFKANLERELERFT